jgi:hypothetical protein
MKQSTSSASRTAAQGILTATLMGLAAAVAGLAQTGVATELPGLVPPAVANGTAVAAGSVSSSQMLRLVIGLQHPHMADEEQFLVDLNTKGSPQYRHFLTADEWNGRFSPSPQDEQAVVDWAQAQGLTVTYRFANRLLVDLEAPASAIQAALGVKINSYVIAGANYYSNDRNPVVPAALGNIVHSVAGLNNIQVMKSGNHGFPARTSPVYSPGPAYALGEGGSHDGDRTKLGAKPGLTNGAYDPTDLYSSEAYDTYALDALKHCCNVFGGPTSPPVSSIAIVSSGFVNGNDIAGFQNQYPYLADNWQQIQVDGASSTPDDEGTLDLEWSTAMANSFGLSANTAKVYVYEAADTNLSTFTDAYNHALSDGLARVFSTSWGGAEFDGIPQSTMDMDHGIFNSMVGQGWTLVAATGDEGAVSFANSGCTPYLAVAYPASDPNMLAAGGTSLQLGKGPTYDTETGWSGGPAGCAYGDGGGGGGFSAYYTAPSFMGLPAGSKRPVPDIALNADGYYYPQNYYFGTLTPTGGTSIVAPEVAGFFAQANAYMLYVDTITGGCDGCSPLGNGSYYLYFFGLQPTLAPHYPFYDITSGCNLNDVTIANHLTAFCAGPGRDEVTGWGSFNFLQLVWAVMFDLAGDSGEPTITFSGPALNKWYNTNQIVSWTISDTSGRSDRKPTGIAGFSQAWDAAPGGGDPTREATPGAGNSFYSGPQFPNQTSGCLDLTGAECSAGPGQGWHTVNVQAWDNTGIASTGGAYGPIGFDTVPPHTAGQASANPVVITLTASDATSGVASTVYQLDSGSTTTYTGPFQVSGGGSHTLTFHSTDNAGNVESTETLNFTVGATTTTAVTSSVNPAQFYQGVAFTATVSSASGTPTGTVTFFNGSTQMGVAPLSAGKAVLKATLNLGSHAITATYAGNATFPASTSPVFTETIVKGNTGTVLTSSPNPSALGQTVTFTATVTAPYGGSPGGTVSFKNGSTVLGSGTVNTSTHKATLTHSFPLSSTYSIQAVYGGNVDFNASTSPVLKQVVQF